MGVPASMVRTKPGSGFVILSDSATAEKLPEAERVADDGSGIIRAVMQMFDDVRFREEPRVFFIPAKGDISAYEAARSDIKYALGRYDGPDGGFKNVRVVFYDGTKADLEAKRSALEDKEALALAFVDSDAVSEAELKAHNTASLRYKWIRESMPEGGVPVGELFMHVAFGLPVLDYVRNSSDPDHKLVLMGIIERMVANGKADLDLIKTDFNNLFVSGIILMLKKITKVDINSEMHKRSRNLKEVLAAA
jgi:hypothetical protein